MARIVLATLNAKYIHAAFGLRYLLANLGAMREDARIEEFDVQQKALDVVEAILAHDPQIVGLGIYIWNVAEATQVVAALKRIQPEVTVVLGGPEVSYEFEEQEIVRLADYLITGEADLKFAEVCAAILAGSPPPRKVITAEVPDLAQVALPYEYYTDEDVAHRVIYIEASRGCPFTCEFCLSSLDVPVRQFPLATLLAAAQKLLDRGVRRFKFVDRTFNLNIATSKSILEFFLDRQRPGLFAHFEMIPDRLPESLREVISKFPPGALQFEVGVQTFNEEISRNISRRTDYSRLADNLRFLRENTGVHVHADLIAGLPGESLEMFAAGFDRLVALGPQEIQVGILKRLRGTPITRHDHSWEMVYNSHPPYEIVRNKLLDFSTLQRLRRFTRFWDLTANSGNFVETTPLLWHGGASPFATFMAWSEWLYKRVGRWHGISLDRLGELLFQYLTNCVGVPHAKAARALHHDWRRAGRRETPAFLVPHIALDPSFPARMPSLAPSRQARHMKPPAEQPSYPRK